MPRKRNFGKRKFYGNQHKNEIIETPSNNDLNTSTSAKKIKIDENSDVFETNNNSNIIVELNVLRCLLNTIAECKNCNCSDSFNVYEEINSRRGLAASLVFLCTNCMTSTTAMTSSKSSNNYDVNIRAVYGMRCIGNGEKEAQTFCGIMNLPPPPSKFERYSEIINTHLHKVCNSSMIEAVNESVNLQNGNADIVAAFDGTWQKRGHTSLNGVVCATSIENSKVIDFECLTKYCFYCKNQDDKPHRCDKNFEGYSGGMEAEGVLNIYRRSEETRKVRYLKYLGDGDSKGFLKVSEAKVYGPEATVEKLECIGHVQKRMGARLRTLRNSLKSKKLSDGKGISGRGRLTDAEIDKLQSYYGSAIRKNCSNSLDDMVKGIWAIYFHRLSSDSNPQHGLCPTGPESWCRYNRAKETGEKYCHKHPLPEAIALAIKPVFRSLTDRKLLEKCMHGRTQNPNESFNSCIWKRLPKTKFIGMKTLKMGVMDAVICFNDGVSSRANVFKSMGIVPGQNMCESLRKIDFRRISDAELKLKKLSKEARKQKKKLKKQLDNAEMKSQSDYGPGMF